MIVTGSSKMVFAPPGGGRVATADQLNSPAAVYSFKHARTAYGGSCLKVERSSDGTTQDIGFTDQGEFDADAFDTFVGVDTARLHTWYDQSGNGYDLVQTTDSLQPIISQDAKGYWRFLAVGGDFLQESSFLGATTNSVVHVVWQAPGDGTSFGGPLGGIDFGASTDFISPWWTVTQSPTSRTQAAAATEGRSRATWDDGGARQHVFKFLNDTEHHYEFGAQALESWASDNPDYTRLTVGKNDFANANNYFYELIISDADEDASTLWAATKSNYGSLFSYADFILVVGDSITSATFPGLGDIWTRDFVTDQSISDMFIQSQGGWRLQDFLDIQDEAINWYVQNLTHTGDAIGIIFMGTNDLVLDEITGAACLVKLKSMASSMRTAGFDKIIATTMLPRNAGATFDTERDAFNVALKADSSGDFDEIADTTANANLEDETNTTYFNGDQVHLTDAGQLELSAVIQTAYEAATA